MTASQKKQEKLYNKFIFLNKLLAFSFSIITLIIYFSFILIIAFKPETLGNYFPIDTSITVGVVLGLSIIIFSILLTFFYTLIANNYLDNIKKKIKL
ncbi:MAG: DUF485 domain-containing protein [Pseudomonadota bacterium]|nr:DUF485 domain-containing protein [Pseudomonadota bacterium]